MDFRHIDQGAGQSGRLTTEKKKDMSESGWILEREIV